MTKVFLLVTKKCLSPSLFFQPPPLPNPITDCLVLLQTTTYIKIPRLGRGYSGMSPGRFKFKKLPGDSLRNEIWEPLIYMGRGNRRVVILILTGSGSSLCISLLIAMTSEPVWATQASCVRDKGKRGERRKLVFTSSCWVSRSLCMCFIHCHSNSIIIFILQVRKLRPKGVKKFTQVT